MTTFEKLTKLHKIILDGDLSEAERLCNEVMGDLERENEIWPCVNIDVDESGNITNAKLYSPGFPAGNHDVYPVRVPYMDEHTQAWQACYRELINVVPEDMRQTGINGIDCAVSAIRWLAKNK